MIPLATTIVYRSWLGPSTGGLIVVLLLIGAALYFWPGLDGTIKKMLLAIGIVCFILWLLVILLTVLAHFEVL